MSSTDSRAPVARRIDTAGAFSEEATFIDSAGQPLFSMLHRPLRHSVRGGLVICPSIYAEMMAAYPMDVAIARSLASRGIAVQRFHYRGAGHSGGDAADVTFSGMCEDALVAANRLRDQIDGAPIAVAGTRFGGLVAASTAAEHPGSPLVLVEPVLEGRRFFRDAWRARLIRDTKELAATRPDHRGLPDALAAEGAVDILGYEIRLTLYESVADRTLARELNEGVHRVLLVQLGRAGSLRRDLETGVREIEGLGCDVDVMHVPDEPTWWFQNDASTEYLLPGTVTAWVECEMSAVRP